jgi:hypothetical protein
MLRPGLHRLSSLLAVAPGPRLGSRAGGCAAASRRCRQPRLSHLGRRPLRDPRAPAREKKDRPAAPVPGRRQSGFSTNLHLRAQGQEKPWGILLMTCERHEAPQFVALLERGAVSQMGPHATPAAVNACDGRKGDSGAALCPCLRRRRVRARTPRTHTGHRRGLFGCARSRMRNRMECRSKQRPPLRWGATRYENTAEVIACCLSCAAASRWYRLQTR